MGYELRDGQGSLFKNDRKTSDSHPNATGKAMVAGKLFYVSSWTKKDRNGDPWMSLSFKPVEESKVEEDTRPPQQIIEDDLPF